MHCGSNNNQPDVLNTVIIKCLAYRSVYGTNYEESGASLLYKLLSFLSHPMLHQTVHRKVITVRTLTVLGIVYTYIGREAQRGVSATVGACDKKMFSVADVSGLVWNSSFGSTISQTTF